MNNIVWWYYNEWYCIYLISILYL